MKTLWTPWRMKHVTGKEPLVDGCLFEPAGTCLQSKELLLLLRTPETVVLLNRFPYTNGHILVAPTRHLGCITDLDHSENTALFDMVQKSTAILKERLQPDGFNIGCNIGATAGAGIADHLHVHIVPRWNGDHNFMTVLDEVRTIPEHIENTFDSLAPSFKSLK